MLPRLVALDLDGTLLRSDGTVSDRSVASLRLAEQCGAQVVLVTGRPPRFVVPLAARIGGHETAICANGGLVWDLSAQVPIAVNAIDPYLVRAVAGRIRAAVPDVRFALEQVRGISREPGWPTLDPRHDDGARTGPLEQIADAPVVKLLIRGPRGIDADQFRDAVRGAVGNRLELTWSVPAGVPLLEASAPGVDKAGALARLADSMGMVAADVIAFGDMPNDVSMLRWAGTGVAMGNAHPELIAVADRVSSSNDADGVAVVLEQVFATDGPARVP